MKLDNLKGLYIAHRGIHNESIIENTIPAFSLAISKKIPIELDINILKDGNIIVYHDNNLKRLIGLDKELSSYNYEELKKLTFPNTNIHIPLFRDVLNLVKGKTLLVVEIKKSDIYSYKDYCKKVVSILENYSGDVVIKSFDIRIVNWFIKNTDYITGLLITRRKKSIHNFLIRKRVTLFILNPDFISVNYHMVNYKVIKDFRKKKPVLVWTIKNNDTLNKVKESADSYLVEDFYFN